MRELSRVCPESIIRSLSVTDAGGLLACAISASHNASPMAGNARIKFGTAAQPRPKSTGTTNSSISG